MKSKLILFFLILVFATSTQVFAQWNYFPFYTADSSGIFKLSEECFKRVNSSFLLPEHVSGAYKKEFNSEKEDASEYVKSLIKYTAISDSILNPFIQSVFKKITEGNPEFKDYTVVLSNWPEMNAAYVGGHVIIFYAPLLSRAQTESQVAAILCHELAHGKLEHVQKSMRKRLDAYYSKEFQKEIKKTLKEEFNVYAKINLLSLKFTFNSRYHSRSLEKAADSLGYLLLLKTKYETKEAVAAMHMLKHVDEPPYSDSITYYKYFKCPATAYDFNRMKEYVRTSIFNVSPEKEDSLIDSLRTHPDCDKRVAYLNDLMVAHPPQSGEKNDASLLNKVQWASAMEMIMALHYYQYYDVSLFNALLYLQHAPGNEFLQDMVALNMYKLYESMKNHELSDYISNYSADKSDAQFNNLLFLINNMRLSELNGFINCFYQSNKESFKQDEFTIAVNYCMSKMADDGKAASLQEKYKSRYKDGRFTDLLEINAKNNKKKKK